MQDHRSLGLAAVSRLRERLAELSDRAAWITEEAPRTHLTARVRELLKRLG
jgi:MoxR-like ATPase